MKVIHTADIHLRSHKDERWRALRALIELAGDEEADIMAISGDLFDRGVDADSLRPRIREIFSGTRFRIVLIPGNHDRGSYGSGLFFGDNITILDDPEKPLLHGKEVRIWGMPFEELEPADMARRLRFLSKRLDRKKTDILLYHGELLDSFYSRSDFGEEGERRYMPVKLSFFDGLELDYVLAGHFHTRFRVYSLEGGGYFVYPGSPVSITRRETGRRCVNIFETGEEPRERLLDTPHYREITIALDPFSAEKPEEQVENAVEGLHPETSVILTVKGYLNSEEQGITESGLHSRISEILGGKLDNGEFQFLVRDIGSILNDGLFRSFEERLRDRDYDPEQAREIRETAIRAMMEAAD
jgi:DNA repair exonuclease SbcCD nuclease subunit